MSRLIDADALRTFLIRAGQFLKAQDDKRTASHAIGKIIEHIENMPTVDAVPVVRCKDCKNYDSEIAWCKIHSCFVDIDGDFCHPWASSDWKMFDGAYYCADGERRAGNE